MGTSRSTDEGRTWTAGACQYSGRTNPDWNLTEVEVAELVDVWEYLEPLAGDPGMRPRLGYSGRWMEDATGRHWHAFDGCVRLSTREGESRRKPIRARIGAKARQIGANRLAASRDRRNRLQS